MLSDCTSVDGNVHPCWPGRFYGGLQIGAIVMGGPTTHLSQVSYYHKFKKSTYDAPQNEAPTEAERGPESAELH